jgi:hypothetical protein
MHLDTLTRHGALAPLSVDEQCLSIPSESVIGSDHPLFFSGEVIGKVQVFGRHPGRLCVTGSHREPGVVALDVGWEEGIRLFHCLAPGYAHLLDEPVLQRLPHPLEAPLRNSSYIGTQAYRFQCSTCMYTGEWEVLMGPHDIVRRMQQSLIQWYVNISKHGLYSDPLNLGNP